MASLERRLSKSRPSSATHNRPPAHEQRPAHQSPSSAHQSPSSARLPTHSLHHLPPVRPPPSPAGRPAAALLRPPPPRPVPTGLCDKRVGPGKIMTIAEFTTNLKLALLTGPKSPTIILNRGINITGFFLGSFFLSHDSKRSN